MYLKINAPFYFVLGILFVLRFSIQSINRKIPPLISSAMELGTKIAAAFVFIPMWKYIGACIAEPLSWCLGAIYLSVVFASDMKKINQKYFIDDKKVVESIDSILNEDEEILWRAKPYKKSFILSSVLKFLPIALIWAAIDITIICIFVFLIQDIDWYFYLFLGIFFLIHLSVLKI